MTENALYHFIVVPWPERPQGKVWAIHHRNEGQPIDAAMLAHTISGLDVVGVGVLRKSGGFSLLRGAGTDHRTGNVMVMLLF